MLRATYAGDDGLHTRSVSAVVLHDTLAIAAAPARLTLDWERDVRGLLQLGPGDVEALSLARAQRRWPDYARCVAAVEEWLRPRHLHGLLPAAELALMACRGARFHHDAALYGGSAFCNLFISEDKGLDLVFPHAATRIPLARGSVVLFDTGQPHAVVRRDCQTFEAADFAEDADVTQVFLTWELPLADPRLAGLLDTRCAAPVPAEAAMPDAQFCRGESPVRLCSRTGDWIAQDATEPV